MTALDMNFAEGDIVARKSDPDTPLKVSGVYSSLVKPYVLADGTGADDAELMRYVSTSTKWDGERPIIRKMQETFDYIAAEHEKYGVSDSRCSIKVEAEGRLSGDVNLTYVISVDYGNDVKGDDLDECVAEYLRRRVWKQRHQPKLIAGTGRD